MARIPWQGIREKPILPHLDGDLKCFDLRIAHRGATGVPAAIDSAHVTSEHGVAVTRRGGSDSAR